MIEFLRASALVAVALAGLIACTVDSSPFENERRITYMRFAGVDVAEGILPYGLHNSGAYYRIEDSAEGPRTGTLRIRVDGLDGEWSGSARQRIEVPVGTRYLDADAFGEWTFDGMFYFGEAFDEVPYVGRATTRWMHIDLAGAQIYMTIDVRLTPVEDGAGPIYEGRVDAWGFMGMTCRPLSGPVLSATGQPEPGFCSSFKSGIALTPNDPFAPPPPFDTREVIGCTVGEPCEGGLRPPAAWPGPPREDG